MKNLIIVLILMITTQAIAFEHVDNSENIREATLTQFFMGHKHLAPVSQGIVQINEDTETIKLTLIDYTSTACPVGQNCIALAVPPKVYEIELPITGRSTGFCGATFYFAERDMTPVDGLKEFITVVDNSTLVCRMQPEAATVITYESESVRTQVRQVSEMHANPLLEQVQLF